MELLQPKVNVDATFGRRSKVKFSLLLVGTKVSILPFGVDVTVSDIAPVRHYIGAAGGGAICATFNQST